MATAPPLLRIWLDTRSLEGRIASHLVPEGNLSGCCQIDCTVPQMPGSAPPEWCLGAKFLAELRCSRNLAGDKSETDSATFLPRNS